MGGDHHRHRVLGQGLGARQGGGNGRIEGEHLREDAVRAVAVTGVVDAGAFHDEQGPVRVCQEHVERGLGERREGGRRQVHLVVHEEGQGVVRKQAHQRPGVGEVCLQQLRRGLDQLDLCEIELVGQGECPPAQHHVRRT